MSRKPLYEAQDVARWTWAIAQALGVVAARFRREGIGRGQVMSAFFVDHLFSGYAAVARGETTLGLGHFLAACEAECRTYEAYEAGKDIQRDCLASGRFETLLLAHVTTDEAMIRRFCRLYKVEYGADPRTMSIAESTWIGAVIKGITEHRLEDAVTVLESHGERIEKRFPGYRACLAAIARRDEVGLEPALKTAAEKWERYARHNLRHQPDAVFFLNGVAFVRMAEWAWGHAVTVDVEHVPKELLGDIQPTKVALGI